MKNKTAYVDSYPYYKTIGISIIINTILVILFYHLGYLGFVWPGINLGNIITTFTAELFIYPEDAVFIGTMLIAAFVMFKRRDSKIEVIDIKEFRILYGCIIAFFTIVLGYMLLQRVWAVIVAILLLFYIPILVSLIFVEKNKLYFEEADVLENENIAGV